MSAAMRDLLDRLDNPGAQLRGTGATDTPTVVGLARAAQEASRRLDHATLERLQTELRRADAPALAVAFATERAALLDYMDACEALFAAAREVE